MNLKKLGKNQRRILEEMAFNDLILVAINDMGRQCFRVELCDEDRVNIYEDVSNNIFQSFIDRELVVVSGWNPCLGIEIIEAKIKQKIKPIIKNQFNQPLTTTTWKKKD